MQAHGEFMTREQVAREWFEREYVPVVEMLRAADLLGRGTETQAYTRVVHLRYMLLRTHAWDEDVLARLRELIADPGPADDDTVIQALLRELR
jgi:hypothetical protein